MNAALEGALAQQMINATSVIENQLDAEIQKLENMDDDDMERMREKRLAALKKNADQKREWMSKGHGQYSEISNEKEFFDEAKKSKNMVCHFYRDSTFRCKIVDKHLSILAQKHVETKFIKISVDKCPFLVEKLKIKVLPTISLVTEGKTIDYIVGFDDLGGIDDFTTDMMEWRLGCAQVITYHGDLMNPPDNKKEGAASTSVLGYGRPGHGGNKIIRGGGDDSDSDNDW